MLPMFFIFPCLLVIQRSSLDSVLACSLLVLWSFCEGEGVVVGDEAPLGGVAQVVSHGVKVVGAHGEEGREKDEEVRVEVKGEVEDLREKRSSWMVCG